MEQTRSTQQLVLVPGFWLGAWAWDEVASDLSERGFGVDALTLPGLEPDRSDRASITLEDQAEAIAAAVGTYDGQATLVIHSGATFPSSLVLDRDPGSVRRAIYVDSGPAGPGQRFNDAVPAELEVVPLPDFDQLRPMLGDLSDAQLAQFRERAVPEPAHVARDAAHLTNDDARRRVPTTIITSSFPSEEMMQLARAGDPMLAETGRMIDLTLVDLPTGHWPMWSRPKELADALAAAVEVS